MSSPSAPSGAAASSLDALLRAAAFALRDNVGFILITGSDRVRWLNGMVTNNIAALQPGEGNYNFFLNAQGRIQADATAWMFEKFIILETARDRVQALIAMLDHFIIMDDVELKDLSHNGKSLLMVAGPHAARLLEDIGISPLVEPMHLRFDTWRSAEIEVVQIPCIVPRFEVLADDPVIPQLSAALAAAGAANATPGDLETLRILSGTPLYGVDIRNSETARDLPQETNQTRALHFAKGCYLGQEIVERIRSRGAVHRTFTGFVLTPDRNDLSSFSEGGGPASALPAPGTVLTSNGKPVGELTSVTSLSSKLKAHSSKLSETSPLSNPNETQPGTIQLALGYLRREALDRAAMDGIQYPGGTATSSELPFSLRDTAPNPGTQS